MKSTEIINKLFKKNIIIMEIKDYFKIYKTIIIFILIHAKKNIIIKLIIKHFFKILKIKRRLS